MQKSYSWREIFFYFLKINWKNKNWINLLVFKTIHITYKRYWCGWGRPNYDYWSQVERGGVKIIWQYVINVFFTLIVVTNYVVFVWNHQFPLIWVGHNKITYLGLLLIYICQTNTSCLVNNCIKLHNPHDEVLD